MVGKIHYSLLTKETAACVGKVIKEVYSESYSELALPSTQQAMLEHEQKDNVVALAFSGEQPIGMISLKRSPDSAKVYELGMLSVVKDYRKNVIANELISFAKGAFSDIVSYDSVYMENVSSHYYSQRKAVKNGAIDCAIMLSAMPELGAGHERLSFITAFFENPLSEPEPVYIPQRYAKIFPYYYKGLKVRKIMPYHEIRPDGLSTTQGMREFPTLGLLKQSFSFIGEDFEQHITSLISYAKANLIKTVQVYLPLSSASISFAVELLKEEKFFIGGVLPFWFGGDGLLLQKCFSQDLATIRVYSSKAKALLQFSEKDKNSKM